MNIQKTRFCFYAILLIVLSLLASCIDDNEPVDKQETVTLYVSANMGQTSGLTGTMHDCMLVKEKGDDTWNTWALEGIKGFNYEKGYDYELLVTKTTYANPTADGGAYGYSLIQIVSKTAIVHTKIAKQASLQQTYPTVSAIISDPTVKSKMEEAWAKMKSNASSSGRNEYGFYIYYDSNSKQYSCGTMVKGPTIAGCEGTNASVSLGIPTNNITVCAFFHCHTTLEYCPSTVSRATGPSSADKSFATTNKLPGILYDYSIKKLVGGMKKDASYKVYTFGPSQRVFP